jgi:hypothetical protein
MQSYSYLDSIMLAFISTSYTNLSEDILVLAGIIRPALLCGLLLLSNILFWILLLLSPCDFCAV